MMSAHNYNDRGEGFLEMGEYDKAIDDFNMAIKADTLEGKFAKPYLNLAKVYAKKGMFQETVYYFEFAVEKDSEIYKTHHSYDELAKCFKKKDEISYFYNKALKINQDKADHYYTLSNICEFKKQPKEAINNIKLAMKLNKKYVNHANYIRLGKLFRELAPLNKKNFFQKTFGMSEGLSSGLVGLRNSLEESNKNYLLAIQLNPKDPLPYYLMSKNFTYQVKEHMDHFISYGFNVGSWCENCIENFDKSIKLGRIATKNEYREVINTLWRYEYLYDSVNYNFKLDIIKLFMDMVKNAMDLFPEEKSFYVDFGRGYLLLIDNFKKEYSKQKEINFESYSKLLNTCYEIVHHNFDKAILLDPKCDNAYYWHGRCYAEQNNHIKAILYYQKAISLNPNDAIYKKEIRFCSLLEKLSQTEPGERNKLLEKYEHLLDKEKNSLMKMAKNRYDFMHKHKLSYQQTLLYLYAMSNHSSWLLQGRQVMPTKNLYIKITADLLDCSFGDASKIITIANEEMKNKAINKIPFFSANKEEQKSIIKNRWDSRLKGNINQNKSQANKK